MSIKPEDYVELVESIARSIKRRLPDSVQVEDLIAAGSFGLIDAASRYDPRRKTKFTTFATPRIRGAILDELRRMDWVPRLVRQRGEEPTYMTNFSDLMNQSPDDDEDSDEFVIEDPSKDIRDKIDLKQRLDAAINQLQPKYQQAVRLYYFDGLTLKEAAKHLGITESRACQIVNKAVPQLKRILESE